MEWVSPFWPTLRNVVVAVASTILVYLFVLLVPLITVQYFIHCNVLCPLIGSHPKPGPGGFAETFVYSMTRVLTGFGPSYNVDDGYVLPSGLPWGVGGVLTDYGVFLVIILPLSIAAVACLAVAFIIKRKQSAVSRCFE